MNQQHLKLGKLPARPNAVTFKLKNFIIPKELPKPPRYFGHEDLVSDWQILGNDLYGDCVFAGAAHETMMWNLEAGKKVKFNDRSVLENYSEVTGFDPNDPATDQGTDMQAAASFRRKTGLVDANGKRHKVEAYLAIDAGNIQQHYIAMYLFGAVGMGIEFPISAMEQFNQGKAWRVVKGSRIDGGHYIPLVAKRKSIECVTWGRLQPMTLAFFKKYNDESIAYVSKEALLNNKSPEGFDAQGLIDCLNSLQ